MCRTGKTQLRITGQPLHCSSQSAIIPPGVDGFSCSLSRLRACHSSLPTVHHISDNQTLLVLTIHCLFCPTASQLPLSRGQAANLLALHMKACWLTTDTRQISSTQRSWPHNKKEVFRVTGLAISGPFGLSSLISARASCQRESSMSVSMLVLPHHFARIPPLYLTGNVQ